MRVAALALEDFRGYERARFDLAAGVTTFIGPNGAGKTNLLEALHLVARGDSVRAHDDAEMIRWGAPLARVIVDATADADTRQLGVTLFAPAAETRRRPRRYTADGAPRRGDEVIGGFTVVAFFPQDTDLLVAAPAARRRYLDAMIAQVDREHRQDMRAYARVLEQRNALLRMGRDEEETVPESELAFWDAELVRLASALSLRRESAVGELRPVFRTAAERIGADPTPDIAYAGQVRGSTTEQRADAYWRVLAEKRERERWQGVTLVGPHRDDLVVATAERPLPTFASRGEQRSAVLALKLAEAEWLRARVGEVPVFLLDDVLSELDVTRREALAAAIPFAAQALITAAVPASIPSALRERAAVVELERSTPA